MDPLIILVIGIVTILGLILVLRVNAFLALIISAIVVSLLAPGAWEIKISRVAVQFGVGAGKHWDCDWARRHHRRVYDGIWCCRSDCAVIS